MRRFWSSVAAYSRRIRTFFVVAFLFIVDQLFDDQILTFVKWSAKKVGMTPTGALLFLVTHPLVAFFGAIGLTLVGIFLLAWRDVRRASLSPQDHVVASLESEVTATPAKPEERIVVDVDVAYLLGIVKRSNTTAEAQRAIKPYLGKWMTVAGPIADVGETKMQLANHVDRIGIYELFLTFDDEWKDRLSVLRKGSAVRVFGQIRQVTQIGVYLAHCTLV